MRAWSLPKSCGATTSWTRQQSSRARPWRTSKSAPAARESHISALYMLGRVQQARGNLEAAEPMLRRAYDLQTRLSGELSDATVNARNGLAELLVVRGKTDEAESLLRRNVDAVRKIYGDSNPTLGIAWNNLANATSDIPEKFGEAEQAYLEAIRILEATLEPGHPEIAKSHSNLGALYIKTGRIRKGGAGTQRLR